MYMQLYTYIYTTIYHNMPYMFRLPMKSSVTHATTPRKTPGIPSCRPSMSWAAQKRPSVCRKSGMTRG